MKKINKTICSILCALLVPGLFLSCSEKQEAVVVIDGRTIDWKMLRRSYHLEPMWGKGLTVQEAYQNQLNYLIDKKLFAAAARRDGIGETETEKRRLEFLLTKEMIKELYRREVGSNVKISEDEYRQAYHRSKSLRQLEIIRTTDRERCIHYAREMESRPLDDIILLDPLSDTKGTTSMFGFGDRDEVLENAAFEMEPYEVRAPLKDGGYYMAVKLIDGEDEKFFSEQEFAGKKSTLETVIFERKARVYSDKYIYTLLKDENVRLNPDTFVPLAEYMQNIVKEKSSTSPLPIHIDNAELRHVRTKIRDLTNEVLVTYNAGSLTVGEFLERLFNMPAGLRPEVRMAKKLKQAIGIIVRNQYLAEKAREQGLRTAENVVYEYGIREDELLARSWLKNKRDRIRISAEEIEGFRTENEDKLSSRLSIELTDQVIRDMALDYKFTKWKMNAADSLRNLIDVEIDIAVMNANIKKPHETIEYNPSSFVYRELFN